MGAWVIQELHHFTLKRTALRSAVPDNKIGRRDNFSFVALHLKSTLSLWNCWLHCTNIQTMLCYYKYVLFNDALNTEHYVSNVQKLVKFYQQRNSPEHRPHLAWSRRHFKEGIETSVRWRDLYKTRHSIFCNILYRDYISTQAETVGSSDTLRQRLQKKISFRKKLRADSNPVMAFRKLCLRICV